VRINFYLIPVVSLCVMESMEEKAVDVGELESASAATSAGGTVGTESNSAGSDAMQTSEDSQARPLHNSTTSTSSADAAGSGENRGTDSATSSGAGSASGSSSIKPHHPNNPVRKLSVNLLRTYRHINEVYYAKKRRRQQMQQEAGKREKRVYNGGFDNENGDYIVKQGDIFNGRYKVVDSKPLGRGSYGQVVKVLDLETNTHGALKVIKNKRAFFEQAKVELSLLHMFQRCGDEELDRCNIVNLMDSFVYKKHQCMLFELLGVSLYDLLRKTRFTGVSLNLVKKFGVQLLHSLAFLRREDVDVLHCDVKPENVLLRPECPTRIKLVDFGSSTHPKPHLHMYVQSRFYRAPEVLMCIPYTHCIDMWSLGCMLVEMHTGSPLFDGRHERAQIVKIVKLLGMPPESMLAAANPESRVRQMFYKDEEGTWKIREEGSSSSVDIAQSRTLKDVLMPVMSKRRDAFHSEAKYEEFMDAILKLLTLDPKERISPEDALKLPFFAESPLQISTASAGVDSSDPMVMSPRLDAAMQTEPQL